MAQIDKNTVRAENQLGGNKFVTYESCGNGIKLLFCGNSITRHSPKSDIGWLGDWGMAALAKEHRLCLPW